MIKDTQWLLSIGDKKAQNLDLTQLLLEHGFTDWAGDPGKDTTMPGIIQGNYIQAVQLYKPKQIIMHVRREGDLYVTTYIPRMDFLMRNQK
jgi:hypothetical protein